MERHRSWLIPAVRDPTGKGAQMAKPEWEDTRRELIETYRILNNEYRGKDEETLAAAHGGTSVKEVVRRMRDDELLFAKALTERLTGDVLGGSRDEDDKPLIGNEVENETARILISQFGSARATTLNTMAGAQDEDWEKQLDKNKTMLDLARELAQSDRANLDKIRATVPA